MPMALELLPVYLAAIAICCQILTDSLPGSVVLDMQLSQLCMCIKLRAGATSMNNACESDKLDMRS